MKKTFKYICLAATLGLTVSMNSCSDFMDLKPEDQYAEDAVWSDAGLVQAVVNDIYAYIVHGSEESNTSALTDDAYFTHDYGMKAINEATVSGSDLRWYDDDKCPFKWYNAYKGIYRTNLFLENIDKVPEKVGYNLKIMKGEVLFLRAYLYTELVRGFGGVPLVDKTYSIEEASQLSLPRSNMADCLDFILKDIEKAIPLLPETADPGRATQGAAKALKARILLHVASPLFADRSVNTLECNQYNGDRKKLYEQARDAAKEVIGLKNYTLVDCNANTIMEIADKYHDISLTNNSESIFYKQFINKDVDDSNVRNRAAQCHGPNGYHNWGGVTPTNDLVMSFEMEDGTINNSMLKIEETTTKNPYLNREPRFYATIGYDGLEWGRPRPSDAAAFDPTPLGTLQMGFYESPDGSDIKAPVAYDKQGNPTKEITFKGVNGVDTRKSSIENWNGSVTGYVEKKLIDTKFNATEHNWQTATYPYIRLAEMYLIAAEACIELNELDDAADFLDDLRGRIGRPDTKTTLTKRGQAFDQENMRKFLQRERRSELAYENSRYYDIRRWMIAPNVIREVTGIAIVARLKQGQSSKLPYIHDEKKWDYTYYVTDLSFRETRKWDNKLYFAPIKRDEIKRNTAIKQNPGME
ncbi:RagB/SusD family nutrient uptake outer membrane protein [Parabacteroides sp. APC149_11_2_Y6]